MDKKDSGTDLKQLNEQLIQLHIDTNQKFEVLIKPSSISQHRIKNILDRKSDFTSLLQIPQDLIRDHKQFLVPKPYESEEARITEFGKRAIYNSYYNVQDWMMIFKNKESAQSGLSRNVASQNQIRDNFHREQRNRCLSSAHIARSAIVEDVTIQQGELKFPIRCAFCRLLKILQFFFRFDQMSRFGKLCLLKDKEGREICSHEMCLLQSRVNVNYTKMTIDIAILIQAVQFAQAQMCRYCGSIGASLKCNRLECHVILIFGLQLDHEQKFRFFCEDHVRHNYQGQSDWFITRIQMKQIIQQGGQPAFTKKHAQIDWSMRDSILQGDLSNMNNQMSGIGGMNGMDGMCGYSSDDDMGSKKRLG